MFGSWQYLVAIPQGILARPPERVAQGRRHGNAVLNDPEKLVIEAQGGGGG